MSEPWPAKAPTGHTKADSYLFNSIGVQRSIVWQIAQVYPTFDHSSQVNRCCVEMVDLDSEAKPFPCTRVTNALNSLTKCIFKVLIAVSGNPIWIGYPNRWLVLRIRSQVPSTTGVVKM